MSTETDEVPLLTLQIQVCQNCVARLSGVCHVPGCFYCRYSIEDVPTYLEAYVVPAVGSEIGGSRG